VFIRDWTTCSNFVIYSKLKNQNHNWRGPMQPFDELNNLHFHIKLDTHMSFENYREDGYNHDLDSSITSH
jgi:hypothetical protein